MLDKIILIVLDSVGIGELPDASEYGDSGSNTLGNISNELGGLNLDNMRTLGLGNIDGIKGIEKFDMPVGCFGKCAESSKGKDTITGHWEIAGLVLEHPMKTYPNGFPEDIITELEEKIGRKVLANKVASGTEIIKEYGEIHKKTGYPIVYTSADSVLQIAADEEVIPLETLYEICAAARKIMVDERAVGRIIARPFVIKDGEYIRTSNRRDYALDPIGKTMLDYLKENDIKVYAIGKIEDIFNKKGIFHAEHIINNDDGITKTIECIKNIDRGLIFTNLVDFDMLYGHRNNINGYAQALMKFDRRLPEIINEMKSGDLLIITADHGCDPTTASTDHSREYIPVLIYGKNMKSGVNIGIRDCFCDIGKTVLNAFEVENDIKGKSFYKEISL
jgi:phosphopentomutase